MTASMPLDLGASAYQFDQRAMLNTLLLEREPEVLGSRWSGTSFFVRFKAAFATPWVQVHVQNAAVGGLSYNPSTFVSSTEVDCRAASVQDVEVASLDPAQRYVVFLIPVQYDGAGTKVLYDGQGGRPDNMAFVGEVRMLFTLFSGNISYAQLPTGGGTWSNGGALAFTGGQFSATHSGLYPLIGIRTSADTNLSRTAFGIQHTTTADMIDGFGVGMDFNIRDSAALDNTIVALRAIRSGADNTGFLEVRPVIAGVATLTATFAGTLTTLLTAVAITGAISGDTTLQIDGNALLGTTLAATGAPRLDVVGAVPTIVTSDVTTDATTKAGAVAVRHYTNAEEPVAVFGSAVSLASNIVAFGGGSATLNAATLLGFYTAATTTTTTGTVRLTIDSAGAASFQGNTVAMGALTATTGTFTGLIQTTLTTQQLSLRYDASNHLAVTVSSAGVVTYDATGASAGHTFADLLTASAGILIPTTQNLAINGTGSFGGGAGVIGVLNATTVPTSNPTGGAIWYVEGGASKARGSSGTITTFGPAEPHCPRCGRDFAVEYENPKYGKLSLCMWCLSNHLPEAVILKRAA